jgi:hypothetical protein
MRYTDRHAKREARTIEAYRKRWPHLSPSEFSRKINLATGMTVPWYHYPDEQPLPFAHHVWDHVWHSRAECLRQLATEDDDFDPSLYLIDDDDPDPDSYQDRVMQRYRAPARTGEMVRLQGICPYGAKSEPKKNADDETADAFPFFCRVLAPGALFVAAGDEVTLIEGHGGRVTLAATGDGTLMFEQMAHGLVFTARVDRGSLPSELRERREMSVSARYDVTDATWYRTPFSPCAIQQVHRGRLLHIALVPFGAVLGACCRIV